MLERHPLRCYAKEQTFLESADAPKDASTQHVVYDTTTLMLEMLFANVTSRHISATVIETK